MTPKNFPIDRPLEEFQRVEAPIRRHVRPPPFDVAQGGLSKVSETLRPVARVAGSSLAYVPRRAADSVLDQVVRFIAGHPELWSQDIGRWQ